MTLQKKLRIKVVIFYAISYICLLTPLLVLCIINRDAYFVRNKSGLSVAFGGMLSVLFAVLLMKQGLKKINKALSATMLLVIVWCLQSIINDMLAVVFCYWLGICLFTIFEIPAKHYHKDLRVYHEVAIKDVAREEIKQKREQKEIENGRV